MPTRAYDVAIIGGGHNGLVCAACLAKAGASVVVLEKNARIGGAAQTVEFAPGYCNSLAAYTVSLLNPRVIQELELAAHGLKIVERPAANFWPLEDGRHLLMPHGTAARASAVAAFSARDAERMIAYDAAMARACAVLRDLVLTTPPNAGDGLAGLLRSAPLARRMIRLDLDDQRLLADLFTRSAADVLDRWFESDVVKGALAFDGIVGAFASPHMPGTAYLLLHHAFGEINGRRGMWGHAIGGMGAISEAIASSARTAGVAIRTDAAVCEVVIDGDRAAGVRLADGETIRTRAVAATVGPKLLMRDLVPADAVEPELRARFLGIKTGSGVFRMNVALAELPDFTCRPNAADGAAGAHHGAGIVFGSSIGYLERAYVDARLTGWSLEPVIEMLIPSTIDPTLAPEGRHVASLFVQHVAPRLEDVDDRAGDLDLRTKRRFRPAGPASGKTSALPSRSWSDPRESSAFADLVIDTVTRYAPGFRRNVIATQTLSPLDIEQRFGMIDGDISHGQMSLDQLFSLRPVLGHADYRMPVKGLYLCGAGAHPGGGVTGAAGYNAAREIMRDLKRDPPWLRGRG